MLRRIQNNAKIQFHAECCGQKKNNSFDDIRNEIATCSIKSVGSLFICCFLLSLRKCTQPLRNENAHNNNNHQTQNKNNANKMIIGQIEWRAFFR